MNGAHTTHIYIRRGGWANDQYYFTIELDGIPVVSSGVSGFNSIEEIKGFIETLNWYSNIELHDEASE